MNDCLDLRWLQGYSLWALFFGFFFFEKVVKKPSINSDPPEF